MDQGFELSALPGLRRRKHCADICHISRHASSCDVSHKLYGRLYPWHHFFILRQSLFCFSNASRLALGCTLSACLYSPIYIKSRSAMGLDRPLSFAEGDWASCRHCDYHPDHIRPLTCDIRSKTDFDVSRRLAPVSAHRYRAS